MKIEMTIGTVRVVVGVPSPNHATLSNLKMGEDAVISAAEWHVMKRMVDKMFVASADLAKPT